MLDVGPQRRENKPGMQKQEPSSLVARLTSRSQRGRHTVHAWGHPTETQTKDPHAATETHCRVSSTFSGWFVSVCRGMLGGVELAPWRTPGGRGVGALGAVTGTVHPSQRSSGSAPPPPPPPPPPAVPPAVNPAPSGASRISKQTLRTAGQRRLDLGAEGRARSF